MWKLLKLVSLLVNCTPLIAFGSSDKADFFLYIINSAFSVFDYTSIHFGYLLGCTVNHVF